MAAAYVSALPFSRQNPVKTLRISLPGNPLFNSRPSFRNSKLPFQSSLLSFRSNNSVKRFKSVPSKHLSAVPLGGRNYEFVDGDADVELRLDIGAIGIQSSRDIFVDVDEISLLIRVKSSGTLITLLETTRLFEKIKPAETIWYIDEDQLVVNLKKYDTELKWPDIMESWESLKSGVMQLLKGTSLYVIGDSTELNQKVARELAVGLRYIPLSTSELLEECAQQSTDSWAPLEGADSVAEAEGVILESLSSHVRAVVATLGGQHGAASKHDKWRHLYAGFTVYLLESKATDEASAKEAACRHVQVGSLPYANADVVVKLGRWNFDDAQAVAQACLSALKQLILSDKQLTGKKSLYIRLGCRGDWPNIKPPGWDPTSGADSSPEANEEQ